LTLSKERYAGQRFTVTNPVQVTAIGGDIGDFSAGPLFGVIVSLAGTDALPSGNPFDSSTVASAFFNAPFPSQDISVPLSVILEPGTYGLIFGSNVSVDVFMGSNNLALPGADFFVWNQQHVPGPFKWTDSGGQPPGTPSPRFVVYGETIVPEPSTLSYIIVTALVSAIGFRRKLRTVLRPGGTKGHAKDNSDVGCP
jgi:hypothetical protein